MAEHVLEYLNAYLDGELNGWRQERVERHLAGCPTCQAELQALRHLSQVLQEAASTPEFPPAERFSAQMLLRLPRQPMPQARHALKELGWWLAPAAILGAWAFVQAVFLLSNGVWTVGQVGLLGEAATWLAPESQGVGALTGSFQWLGVLPSGIAQEVVAFSEGLGRNLLVQLLLEGGLGLLYLGWLSIWWLRRQQASAGYFK